MFLLKFLVILCVFAQTVLTKLFTDEDVHIWNNLIAPYYDDCLLEANISSEEADAIITEMHISETKEVGNYLKCLYLKLGMIKANGEIDEKVIMDKAAYMTPEITKKCKKATDFGKDVFHKSLLLGDCVLKTFS
ncbi:hypothetical protein RN001_011381 [Aquatica leii]|uniref:Uncharacterized protein n=1 Tax=Aquatica leii TaxID=1421715 RepID=A0AAN7P281_9COLE|nr:hypothetical protein RN001_011381 [Aquatica leii]